MTNLNIRARIEISADAMLLLTSCSMSDRQRDEVEDIADPVAYDAFLEDDRIDELEGRISEIETRLEI